MKVFGRPLSPSDPLFRPLSSAAGGSLRDRDRAVLGNLVIDERVSPAAASTFAAAVAGAGVHDAARLVTFLGEWHDRERTHSGCGFCSCPTTRVAARPALFRLLNLNGVRHAAMLVRQHAHDRVPPWIASASSTADGWAAELDRRLRARRRKAAVADCLQLLATHRELGLWFEPAWCTPWDDVKSLVRQRRAAMLLRRLGLPSPSPEWWVGLRYDLPAGVELHMPTQLAAGKNPLHFPTPRASGVGAAMPLDAAAVRIAHEYVHAQIPHRVEHFEAADELVVQAPIDLRREAIPEWRSAQLRRLVRTFPAVNGWMTDANSL